MSRRWKGPTGDELLYNNPKSFVYHEKYLRRCLAWAIKNFDKTHTIKDRWLGTPLMQTINFDNLRKYQIPKMLAEYVKHKEITPDQATTLLLQTASEDRADWFIAFTIIKNIKNLKKLK